MTVKLAGCAWATIMAAAFLAGCQQPQKAVGVAASAEAPAQGPADPTVSVFGLGVRTAKYDDVLKLFKPATDYGTSDQSSGIDLVLHVATEHYDLVSLERVVVESLTDEAGHDLSLGMTQSTSRLFFPADSNVSLDHKHGFIALHFSRSPAAATGRMTLRGTMLARSGGKQQMLTFNEVPFAKGSKFQVLGHDYTLDNIYSYDSRPDQVNFSFTSDGSYDEVRAIRFLSPDGKRVVGTISRVDRNVRQPTQLLCQVTGEKPQAMRIEVDTYEKPMELAIPFQLNLDLGVLGAPEPLKLVTTGTLPAAPVGDRIKSQSQVLALTMSAPIGEQQAKEWFGERTSVATFRRAGLNILVKVHVADRKMVRLSAGPGMALSLMDDTGGSLLATAAVSGNNDQSGARNMTSISRDGHDALVTISTASLPTTGARELRFKGKIGVVMEESEKILEAKGVALVPGTSFKVGDTDMTVLSVRAAGAAGNGMSLTIMANKVMHGTVVLLDGNGKQLAAEPFVEDRYRRQTDGSPVMITLPKALDTATVQVRTTSDDDAVSLPVEFTVPIGLGGEK